MPLKRQAQLLAGDAAAVVRDPDLLDATLLELDFDDLGSGVEAGFEQLLEHRGGALDDFAGGDLVDQDFGEAVDRRHGGGLGWSVELNRAAGENPPSSFWLRGAI